MTVYLAAHRLGMVCMAAKRGLRWHAIANLKGGYIAKVSGAGTASAGLPGSAAAGPEKGD